ncbi:DUF2914 domain-containing protein [Patescibacteria group bacterium]
MKWTIEKIKHFIDTNGHYAYPAAFLTGFIVDNFTLTRIDLWFDNLILFSYLLVAGISIALFSIFEEKELGKFTGKVFPWIPIVMQFAFGGLFSGYLIFYTRSASLAASWFFVLLLTTLFIGNEFLKKHYARFTFRTSIFFLAIFSFTIFYVPIVLNTFGAWTFILSGTISLLLIWFFVFVLSKFIPNKIRNSKKMLIGSIGAIYVAMNIMYFTNIIPPIPLSLKDAGVYHLVERIGGGNYEVLSEQKKWYEFLQKEKFHRAVGEPAYVYSSVFAPTDINTEIFHRWQYFDSASGEWETTGLIQFPIAGGRDEGYRGYSMKHAVFPGDWRVDVITKREQLLGRVSFEIVDTQEQVDLQSKIK